MTDTVHELHVLDVDGTANEDVLQEFLADDPNAIAPAFLGHRFETYGEVPTSDGCGGGYCIVCITCYMPP